VRALLWCLAVLALAGCGQTVGGLAVRAAPGLDEDSLSPVDVDAVLLDPAQMRALTGGGLDLTIIPSMDGKAPVDLDMLVGTAPPQCGWYFAETRTFGDRIEEFHKTTYQYPPQGALISQGAAGYRDAGTARGVFDALRAQVADCAGTPAGRRYIGEWTATADRLQTRTDDTCGRDYTVKSAVLVEVTFCGFSAGVPDLVMTNILNRVPN
jgi:hypothetical protein